MPPCLCRRSILGISLSRTVRVRQIALLRLKQSPWQSFNIKGCAFVSPNDASSRPYLTMALLSYLILLSMAQLITAPPPMLLPNSTTGNSNGGRALCDEGSNTEASNVFAQAPIATTTMSDQRELIDLGYNFNDLNESLSVYCLNVQESSYLSWKTTNTHATGIVTCIQNVAEGQWDDAGTYTETYMPEFTPTLQPPCCGQCAITASRASAFFWPTPAPQPKISTLVGADGFT